MGFSDEYIKQYLNDTVWKFGGTEYPVIISQTGKEYQVQQQSYTPEEQHEDGTIQTSKYYIISIALPYARSTLSGISKDITNFNYMLGKNLDLDDPQLTVDYYKLNDKNGTVVDKQTIINYLEDAVSKNPEMLIFHFSDHGNYKNGEGYICLDNDDTMTNTELFGYFKKFKRVFALFCCCHPWSGVSLPEDASDLSSKIMIWAPCATDKSSYNKTYYGHHYMLALKKKFKKGITYDDLWSKVKYNYDNHKSTPYRYNYNNFDETYPAFT